MPHGALILDPERSEMAGTPLGGAARRLHEACFAAGCAVRAAHPHLIILYTPHGLHSDSADMCIYQNSSASGSCDWMGAWGEFRVSVQCDAAAARSLLTALQAGGHSAAGLTAFSGYDAPLRWGECVPLSFLGPALSDGAKVHIPPAATPTYMHMHVITTTTLPPASTHRRQVRSPPQVVVLSHGPAGTLERAAVVASRRSATAAVGEAIHDWAAGEEQRVFLLISADLAHVHGNARAPRRADGVPDPRYLNARYASPHACAEPFERAVARWVETGSTAALDGAVRLAREAMCCGIEGFVLLDAAMRRAEAAHTSTVGGALQGSLLAHEARPLCLLTPSPLAYPRPLCLLTRSPLPYPRPPRWLRHTSHRGSTPAHWRAQARQLAHCGRSGSRLLRDARRHLPARWLERRRRQSCGRRFGGARTRLSRTAAAAPQVRAHLLRGPRRARVGGRPRHRPRDRPRLRGARRVGARVRRPWGGRGGGGGGDGGAGGRRERPSGARDGRLSRLWGGRGVGGRRGARGRARALRWRGARPRAPGAAEVAARCGRAAFTDGGAVRRSEAQSRRRPRRRGTRFST